MDAEQRDVDGRVQAMEMEKSWDEVREEMHAAPMPCLCGISRNVDDKTCTCGRGVVPAQQGRRHVSGAAMSIYAGKWKVSAFSVETDLADAGLVMMTVAEVEAMELRSRDRQIQDCAVADLCAQVRDAETERDTLRAQLAEREAKCERLKAWNHVACLEVERLRAKRQLWARVCERLRGGKDEKLAIDANSMAGAGVLVYRGLPFSMADPLDHRLGLGPQPATETVEPMSAQSWRRRGFP